MSTFIQKKKNSITQYGDKCTLNFINSEGDVTMLQKSLLSSPQHSHRVICNSLITKIVIYKFCIGFSQGLWDLVLRWCSSINSSSSACILSRSSGCFLLVAILPKVSSIQVSSCSSRLRQLPPQPPRGYQWVRP